MPMVTAAKMITSTVMNPATVWGCQSAAGILQQGSLAAAEMT